MIKRFRLALVLLLGVLVALPILLALGANLEDAVRVDTSRRLEPPGASAWFGTDELGRDLLTRLAHGTALSVASAALSIVVALSIALVLGVASGLTPTSPLARIIDFLSSLLFVVPFFLLAVAAAAVFEPTIVTIYLLVGAIVWPAPCRLVRTEILQLRRAPHVLAERAFGIGPVRHFFRTYLPMTLLPPLIALVYMMPELLAIDVGLAFFGLGPQPNTPTLGRLVFEGLTNWSTAWWTALLPLSLLFAICLALNTAAVQLAAQSRRK